MTHQHTLSIAFQTNKPINAYGPLAEAAEGYGFDGVSVYNDMLYQPAWLPLLEMAPPLSSSCPWNSRRPATVGSPLAPTLKIRY